jgi:hypothetical protein
MSIKVLMRPSRPQKVVVRVRIQREGWQQFLVY